MSGWIVPKTETAGPGSPMSAGPACVPADLRTNPKHIAAIPNGIARTPIEPIGPPLLPTSPYNGNARPPTPAEESTPIAARIVRSTGRRVPPIADRSRGRAVRRYPPQVGWVSGELGCGCERGVGMPTAVVERPPLRASGESLSLRQPSRVEGGELDQGHFRSARRSRDDGRCGRDRSAGRGHVVAGRR